MTKEEAKQAMLEGKKVRHRYFSDNEYMSMNANKDFVFEDGVICTGTLFWSDRQGPEWDIDWEIVE